MKDSLKPYVAVAQMLVQTFGTDCEVVLHDLDAPAHSVVYVENNTVTGRTVGQSFDQLVRQVILSDDLHENYVANYYFTAPNGKYIRSSTLLIKEADGRLSGAMCINLDTTRVQAQIEYLQSFLPQPMRDTAADEHKLETNSEHISVMIEELMDNILSGCDISQLSREARIEKVRFMEQKGIFLMKGSVEKAAEKLGVNKVTIYSYLDEVRGKRR